MNEEINKDLIEGTEFLKVKTIMTEDVVPIMPSMSLIEVINLFIEKNISGAPIVDEKNKVISVISEVDLMKFALMGSVKIKVAKYMNKLASFEDIVSVQPDDPVTKVYKQFFQKPVRRVIVIDKDGYLKGVVSRKNILKVFANLPDYYK